MDLILRLLKIPSHLHNEAAFVLFIGVIVLGGSSALGVFTAIQSGLQRMDISNKIAVFTTLISALGTIFFIEKGYGLRGLMVNNLMVLIISGSISVIAAFRLIPELKLNIFLVNRKMFRNLLSFGYKMQAARVADVILFQTDRFLIAGFLNVSLVGFYQLGATIIQLARQIPLILISALLPAASEIDAKKDHEKLERLYLRGSKYMIFLSFPVILFVAASAEVLMAIWMGPGFQKSAFVIQILAVGYLVNLIAGVGVTVSIGMGKPEFQMNAAILTMVLNIVMSVPLVIKIGFYGVAYATTVALISGPVYFFIKLHDRLGISTRVFMRKIILMPLAGSIIPALILYILNVLLFRTFLVSWWSNFLFIILEMMIFTCLYMPLILKSGFFDEYDIQLLRKNFALLDMCNRFSVKSSKIC